LGYIDNVRLTLVPRNILADTVVACNTNLTLGSNDCAIQCNMSVVWRTGSATGAIIAGANGLSLTVTPNVTTVYVRTVTISGQVFISACTVTVIPATTIAISGNGTICQPNTNTTLTATVTPTGTVLPSSIIWTLNGTQVDTGFVYTPTLSGTYIVYTNTDCPAADTIGVTVVPAPPSISLNIPPVVCAGNAFAASSNFVNNDRQYTYTWSVLNAANQQPATGVTILPNANANNISIQFANGGKYLVQITVVSGINSACTKVYSQEIAVVGNCCVKNSAGATVPVSQLTLLGNPYKKVTYTTATFPGNNNSTALNYLVVGDISIDNTSYASLNITNSIFYMKGKGSGGGNVGLTSPSVQGTYIEMTGFWFNGKGVTFRAACDTMWGGLLVNSYPKDMTFFLQNSTTGTTKSSLVQDSYEGIVFKRFAEVADTTGSGYQPLSEVKPPIYMFKSVSFRNNYKSIQMVGMNSAVGTNPDWQKIESCTFDCNTTAMKAPFQPSGSGQTTRRYTSYAHITLKDNSGLGWSNTTTSQRFRLNSLSNALYGIYAENHIRPIYAEENSFKNNLIAGIYHTGGNLNLINGNSVLLPDSVLTGTSLQITTERISRNLTAEGGLENPAFGIYAANGCNDLIAQRASIRSNKNQPTVASPDSLPLNHIGYFGRNVNFTMDENGLRGADTRNGVWFMKHGVQLIGAGDYSIRATGFVNNRKAIVFGTDAGSPVTLLGKEGSNNATDLSIRCNEFIRQQSGTNPAVHNIQNVQCIGLSVEGAIKIREIGSLQNPNGNEVRTSLSLCTSFNQNGQCTQAPTSTLLDFFRAPSLIPNSITYYCYNQENIDYYQDYSLTVHRANIQATDTTCFSDMGVLNRKGNTNTTTSTKGFLDSRSITLEQNYPNPVLYGNTEIKYGFPANAEGMSLVVYDLRSGKKMAEQLLSQAEGVVLLNTEAWTAGIYSYCLVQQGRVITAKKMAIGQ
jgi:hypothetical protein